MIKEDHDTRCRIYAPVGAHRDLLAYLVRRLLENGANSSFVNQIVDEDVPPEDVARDPFTTLERLNDSLANPAVTPAPDLFAPSRRNSRGWDLTDPLTVGALHEQMAAFRAHEWHSAPIARRSGAAAQARARVVNPAVPGRSRPARWKTPRPSTRASRSTRRRMRPRAGRPSRS